MNKTKLFVLSIFIILLITCTTIEKKEFSPVSKNEISEIENTTNNKVIIFYRSTKFRDDVVEQLITKFNEEGITVVVDNIDKFKKYNSDEYSLIIIFTGIYALTPNYPIRNAMKKSEYKDKIIHVYCNYLYGKDVDFMYDKNTLVDTVTSASTSKNIDKVVEEIIKISKNKIKN